MHIVAVDLETMLISPSLVAPPIVAGSFAEQDGASGLIPGPEVGVFIRTMIEGGARIVGANIAYDMFCAINEWPELRPLILEAYDRGQIHDVILREQLLDIRNGTFRFEEYENDVGETSKRPLGYNLGELAKRRQVAVLNKGADSWRLRYNQLLGQPLETWPREARDYAVDDAIATLGVYQEQERVGGEYLAKTEADQTRAALALHALGARGVCVDPEALEALEAQLKGARDAIYPELVAAGIYRAAGTRDMKHLKKLVQEAYERVGESVPMTKGTERSEPEVKTAMAVLRDSGDPLLGRLAEFGKVEKMLTTFVPALWLGANFPLTCSYNTLVNTGRTSCKGIKWGKLKGPQFENFPRMAGVRDVFVPRPGHYFCSVDYAQIELCTLAQIVYDMDCGSVLRDAINNDRDLHIDFACDMNGWLYDEVIGRKNEAPYKEARQAAKAANYGFPGGLGSIRFIGHAKETYGVTLTWEEARSYQRAFKTKWSDVAEYQRLTGLAIEENGSGSIGVTIDRTGFERGRCTYTSACNTPFQGLAASGAKRALWALFKQTEAGVNPVVFAHDEVICELPIETAHEAAQLQTKIMLEEMQKLVPDVKVSAEPALMNRWSKEAKTKYVEGRLVPWR